MTPRKSLFLTVLLALTLLLPGVSYALEVKKIERKGTLELSDGRRVSLAGIVLFPETTKMLPSLLAGRSVKFREEDRIQPELDGVVPGYLTVEIQEAGFPPESGKNPDTREILLNAWLLRKGAAKILIMDSLHHQEELRKAQQEAQEKGEGIWSYEKKP